MASKKAVAKHGLKIVKKHNGFVLNSNFRKKDFVMDYECFINWYSY
jgi:hypothetical protein